MAVTGEMLAARDYPHAAQAFAPGQSHCRYSVRCCPERSVADDWVFGIGINIQHRSKIQIDAEETELGGNGPTHSKGKIGIGRFADQCGRRKMSGGRRETKNSADFFIDG